MRRSWCTTEAITTLLGLILFITLGLRHLRIEVLNEISMGLLACVMINRALFKRDRVFFDDPAVMGSGEFVCLLLGYALTVTAMYRFHLDQQLGILQMAGLQAVYVLSRGWAKRNTVRHGIGRP